MQVGLDDDLGGAVRETQAVEPELLDVAGPFADLPNAVGPQTRLAAISHVSWMSGATTVGSLSVTSTPPPSIVAGTAVAA